MYTLYNFTGVSTLRINVTNNNSTSVTVKLYKNQLFFDDLIRTFTVSGNTTTSETIGLLSPDSKYYFKFTVPCDVSGSITAIN